MHLGQKSPSVSGLICVQKSSRHMLTFGRHKEIQWKKRKLVTALEELVLQNTCFGFSVLLAFYWKPYLCSSKKYMFLENSMRELPSLSIFKTNIHRVDLASLVEDSSNCCNLCSMWLFTIICIVKYFFMLSKYFKYF